MADTPDETLPLLDLMVEAWMSRERAEWQLAAGLVTVDGQPVKGPDDARHPRSPRRDPRAVSPPGSRS